MVSMIVLFVVFNADGVGNLPRLDDLVIFLGLGSKFIDVTVEKLDLIVSIQFTNRIY